MKIIAGLVVTLSASAAVAQYQTVDFSSQFNAGRNIMINGSTFPTGNQTYGGVPFALGGAASTSDPWAWSGEAAGGVNPRTLTVPTSIYGVQSVYSIIGTFWGQGGPNSYASITFNATGGLTHTVNLIGNVDIRDHNQLTWTNSINGTTTTEVWNNNQGQRLDRQAFALPSGFASETLTSIVISDNGANSFQRLAVMGLTVQVPTPGSTAVLGLGGLAAVRRRRR